MGIFTNGFIYDFHAKDLLHIEAVKPFADHVVKEIRQLSGSDADVEVHIEPEAKDKRLYNVAINVHGVGRSIHVEKSGKNVVSVLRKVRRGVVRQVLKMRKKRVQERRSLCVEKTG